MTAFDYRRKEVQELASIDESADYEIDISVVGYDVIQRKFVLLTASGCSCWDGDYEEECFDTFDAVKNSLRTDTRRRFTPSLRGAEELIQDAERTIAHDGIC
jgi:hypothetical protein